MSVNKRSLVWVLLASGVVALAVAVWFFPKVFPISGLRLKVYRGEAQQIATRFLEQVGVEVPPGYTRVATFWVDYLGKRYFEQKLGIPRANAIAQNKGFIYIWHIRWFRPGRQEQYFVGVDPGGRVLSYVLDIPNDAPLPPSRRPKQVAEEFLHRTMGIDHRGYRQVLDSKEPLAARVDYRYIWERGDPDLSEAKERLDVIVSGDRVIQFARYLHVPESFIYFDVQQRSRGQLIAQVAFSVKFLFVVLLLAVLLFGIARRELRWKPALVPAMLVAGVYLLNRFNAIPLQIANMKTEQTWWAFWTSETFNILFATLLQGLLILLLILGAELVYRYAFPQATSLYFWFTWRGWAHREGVKRVALGYWLFAIKMLYIVVFTVATRRFMGAWAETWVPYDDLLSTAVPWVYSLLIGIEAAVSEEMLFRVFVIALFCRYLKSTWVGIIVSAVVWAALHCTYPTVPYYLRLVELLLPGILYGWIVVQLGPLTTIMTHALYNAAVSSNIFLYSDQWQVRLSFGLVVFFMLLPALLTWYWSRRLGETATEPPVNQQAECELPLSLPSTTHEELSPEQTVVFPSIGRNLLRLSGIVLAILILLSLVYYKLSESQKRFKWAKSESNPLRVHFLDSRQALEVAKRYLPQKGAEVRGWQVGVTSNRMSSGDEYQYLRRFLSDTDASALWERVKSPGNLWQVRWWKPGSREAWYVLLTPEGKFWERYRILPEEAPGKKLTKEQAQRLAEAALEEHGYPLRHLRLAGSTEYHYPARSFHMFRWRIEGLTVGKALFFMEVRVNGDVATDVYHDVEVPSSELFQREVSTVRRVMGGMAILVVILVLTFWSFRVFVQLMRRYRIPWGWAVQPSLVVTALILMLALLQYPEWMAGMPETVSREAYMGTFAVSALVIGVLLFLAMMTIAPYVPAWRAVYPDLPSMTDWWRVLWRPRDHRVVWREAIIGQVVPWGMIIVLVLAIVVVELLAQPGGKHATIPQWLQQMRVNAFPAPIGIASYSPFLSGLGLGLLVGLMVLTLWLTALPLLKLMFGSIRRCLMWYLLLTVPGALLFAEWWEALQYLLGVGVFGAGIWVLYRWILRYNPLTLFVFWVNLLFMACGYPLLYYGSHRVAGALLLALVVVPLMWAVVDWLVEWLWRNRSAGAQR